MKISKISISQIKNKIVYLFFVSIFFSGISIANFGNFSLTVPYIVSFFVFLFSVMDFKILIIKKKFLITLLFICCIFNSAIFSNYPVNINANLQYIYWVMLFLCVTNTDINYQKNIEKYILVFLKISFILSIYAIYQFISYNFLLFLPLKEIIPTSFMSIGYNTIQKIALGGQSIVKAHSIYLEASTLSQLSAISIIFSLCLLKKIKRKVIICYFLVFGLSLLLSLSGTGLMMLGIYFLYQLLVGRNIKTKAIIIFLSISGVALFMNSSAGAYIFGRVSELSLSQSITTYNSGYYRFILPFIIGIEALHDLPFGYGPGNDDIALSLFSAYENSMGNGYGKIFVEFGIMGLFTMLLFLYYLKPKKSTDITASIFIIVIMCNLVGMSMVKPEFWCFATMLNYKSNKGYVNDRCA